MRHNQYKWPFLKSPWQSNCESEMLQHIARPHKYNIFKVRLRSSIFLTLYNKKTVGTLLKTVNHTLNTPSP